MAKKRNLKRKMNLFYQGLYIESKIDNTQQNRNCRLCDDKDETINQMVSEDTKI